MTNKFIAPLIVPALLLSAAPAFAEGGPASSFGERGNVVLAVSQDFVSGPFDLLLAGSAAEAAFFITSNLSLGLRLGGFWGTNNSPIGTGNVSTSIVAFQAGPRLGYDLALGEYLSLWPQVGVDIRYATQSASTPGAAMSQSANTLEVAVAVSLPLMIHPTKGFFVGVGPRFSADIANSQSQGTASSDLAKTTALGLFAVLGGSF